MVNVVIASPVFVSGIWVGDGREMLEWWCCKRG